MESKNKDQTFEEQMCQKEDYEKQAENIHRPHSFVFERQPTRYAWFVQDTSHKTKERGDSLIKRNDVTQTCFANKISGDLPKRTLKISSNAKLCALNQKFEFNVGETANNRKRNIVHWSQRNIPKRSETNIKKINKRICRTEDSIMTTENRRERLSDEDKIEIIKEAAVMNRDFKEPHDGSINLKNTMEHGKKPSVTRSVHFSECSDGIKPLTFAEQNSDTKSSDTYNESMGVESQITFQANPEGTLPMNIVDVTSADKNRDKIDILSPSQDTEKEVYKNTKIFEANENRIFGKTPDNMMGINTEAVKFSFGSTITEIIPDEMFAPGTNEQDKTQNETSHIKHGISQLSKLEGHNVYDHTMQSLHENINTLNECHLEKEENDSNNVTNCSETCSHIIKLPQNSDFDFGGSVQVVSELWLDTKPVEKLGIENDTETVSSKTDLFAQNSEIVCKTCLAIQAAENFKHLTNPEVVEAMSIQLHESNTLSFCDKNDYDPISHDESTDSQKRIVQMKSDIPKVCQFTYVTDETILLSDKQQSFSSLELKGSSVIKKQQSFTTCGPSVFHGYEVTEPSQIALLEHKEQPPMTNVCTGQNLVKPRASFSSENSSVLEEESQGSTDTQITEQVARKKRRYGWFRDLFSRIHKKKQKKHDGK